MDLINKYKNWKISISLLRKTIYSFTLHCKDKTLWRRESKLCNSEILKKVNQYLTTHLMVSAVIYRVLYNTLLSGLVKTN